MRVTRWFMVDSEEESIKNQMQVNDLFQCLCTWLSKLEDTRWVVTTARDVRIEVGYPRYNTTFLDNMVDSAAVHCMSRQHQMSSCFYECWLGFMLVTGEPK